MIRLLLLLCLLASPVQAQVTGGQIGRTGAQLPGTTTNDNAAAGNIGEFIQSTVIVGSAVPLTTATPANVTSVTLTGGDWDCAANLTRHVTATTSFTLLQTSISTTSATNGTLGTTMNQFATAANIVGADLTAVIGPIRESLAAGNTTVFLVATDTFTGTGGTDAGYGQLRCRRVR